MTSSEQIQQIGQIDQIGQVPWQVKYEDLESKRGRRPFFKRSSVVTAGSRKEAIAQVQCMFPPPHYGNYRASKVKA